jgi:hypothetical protein
LPKYGTVVFDTIGEMARLYFSKAIGKKSSDMDKLRNVSHYQPTTERLNIFTRRLDNLKKLGTECVFIGHEQIDKIYAKGGEIAGRGQQPQEPIGVRGIPDLPGSTFPEELLRKCDVILRMRNVNGKPTWVCKEEPLGGSLEEAWVAGARFDAGQIRNGYLPPSYTEIRKEAERLKIFNWQPPYIWMIYGRSKIGKTTVVLKSFPSPIKLYDFDKGSHVLGPPQMLIDQGIEVHSFDVENDADYNLFTVDFETCFKP